MTSTKFSPWLIQRTGVDSVQEKFVGQGSQGNQSVVQQAKAKQISDFLRSEYKSTADPNLSTKDKPTTLDRNAD